jgi:hypothetical protein
MSVMKTLIKDLHQKKRKKEKKPSSKVAGAEQQGDSVGFVKHEALYEL